MKIRIIFEKCYEPGENMPPIFENEKEQYFDLDSIPRYKDQILAFGHKYIVKDVYYVLDPKNKNNSVYLRAFRRIPMDEYLNTERERR